MTLTGNKDDLGKLVKLLFSKKQLPPELDDLYIVNENQEIIIINGSVSWHGRMTGEGKLSKHGSSSLSREEILTIFSEIDFLMNRLIILLFIDQKSNRLRFEDILDTIQFTSKINLLKKWNIISKSLYSRIRKVNKIRNSFAHKFDLTEIKYGDDFLSKNSNVMRDDVNQIWIELVKIYQKTQMKYLNLKSLIKTIEEY